MSGTEVQVVACTAIVSPKEEGWGWGGLGYTTHLIVKVASFHRSIGGWSKPTL